MVVSDNRGPGFETNHLITVNCISLERTKLSKKRPEVVASDSKGPVFESSQLATFVEHLSTFHCICLKRTNIGKQKEATFGPFYTYSIWFTTFSLKRQLDWSAQSLVFSLNYYHNAAHCHWPNKQRGILCSQLK